MTNQIPALVLSPLLQVLCSPKFIDFARCYDRNKSTDVIQVPRRIKTGTQISGQHKNMPSDCFCSIPKQMNTKKVYDELNMLHAWDVTKAVAETFCREAEALGVRCLIVVIPPPMVVHKDRYDQVCDDFSKYVPREEWDFYRIHQSVVHSFTEAGLPVLDVEPALQEAATERGQRVYFYHDQHLTKDGHVVVADQIVRVLLSGFGDSS